MISKELKFSGKHADLLKKYSETRNTSEEINRIKIQGYSDARNKETDLIIFDTYFNAFVISSLLGLKMNKKTKMDTDSTKSAGIFAEIMVKNSQLIRKIYLYYIFVNTSKENTDENIKKAFSATLTNDEINLFSNDILEYSCSGLELIDSLFAQSKVIEDVLISINQMLT